jgi:hypothetical protein
LKTDVILGELTRRTKDFVTQHLPVSFLRDLVLAEIMVQWYWFKSYFSCSNTSAASTRLPVLAMKSNKVSVYPPNIATPTVKKLRSKARNMYVQDLIKAWDRHGFYRNVPGRTSTYVGLLSESSSVVLDTTTGLMWQRYGSLMRLSWLQAHTHVAKLNERTFAGYSDWRLPTIEELGSLLRAPKVEGSLCIDSVFCENRSCCWSADSVGARAWAMDFSKGAFKSNDLSRENYVRVVREVRRGS